MTTLEQIEQEVARRTGPYFQAYQDPTPPTTSTPGAAVMPILKSSALLGGPENLWLLRRGHFTNPGGPPIGDVVVPDVDRQRLVHVYDPGAGRVIVERNWQSVMQPGEVAEFTHLDPTQELRPAVLAGLRRCFFDDTVESYVSNAEGDIDLTAQHAWITHPRQVLRVRHGWWKPYVDAPFEAQLFQGHVLLSGTSGSAMPSAVWVTALRPHNTWVNGAESSNPTQDSDELIVDLDYAAAAGHIEAWHLFPSRMLMAAATGLQATREQAAEEFTRQSMIWGPSDLPSWGFRTVVGQGVMGVAL